METILIYFDIWFDWIIQWLDGAVLSISVLEGRKERRKEREKERKKKKRERKGMGGGRKKEATLQVEGMAEPVVLKVWSLDQRHEQWGRERNATCQDCEGEIGFSSRNSGPGA